MPQQRGWGQHLVLAEVGSAGGLQDCLVVSLWWTHIPSAASLLLPIWPPGLHGQRTSPFPLGVFTGFIPWVHMLLLAFLLPFEMPVLLGILYAEGLPYGTLVLGSPS